MLSQSVPLVSGYSFDLISGQLEQLAGPKTRYSVGSENPGQFRGTSSMSALSQKQTLKHASLMSALPPEADILRGAVDVCKVPEANQTQ